MEKSKQQFVKSAVPICSSHYQSAVWDSDEGEVPYSPIGGSGRRTNPASAGWRIGTAIPVGSTSLQSAVKSLKEVNKLYYTKCIIHNVEKYCIFGHIIDSI